MSLASLDLYATDSQNKSPAFASHYSSCYQVHFVFVLHIHVYIRVFRREDQFLELSEQSSGGFVSSVSA